MVRKIKNESAVWKISTLSSKISSTARHKTRNNEGKQHEQGQDFRFCPGSDLWEGHFQRLQDPGWLPCIMFIHSENIPSAQEWVLSWSPARHQHTKQPNVTTTFNATAHACSEEVLQEFRCLEGEKFLQKCGFVEIGGYPAPWHSLPRENGSEHSDKLLAHFWIAGYFWLLQAGESTVEKRLIKAQAMRFFWLSSHFVDSF